ncbi:MAG: tannase/feruloyl esterase family alpha/beta hydrolase [Candidatus Acidiferrales bacterium]
MPRHHILLLPVPLALILFFPTPSVAQRSCENLRGLSLSDTTIVSAKSVPAGPFIVPSSDPQQPARSMQLPAFCRVSGVIKPTADSDIKFELWMPRDNWNGKFDGVGNGGFAGSISYSGLIGALRAGFATASTDTGHEASGIDARWALHHPDRIVDFGYRAIHLTNVTGKALVAAFYGSSSRYSYFSSCSNGGRQGLMEAQRFPEDYDGIIAGAPANFWTHLLTEAIWDLQATLKNPASYIPASKLQAIHDAVLAACDAQDGVKDGILNNPRQCHFRPESLLCGGAETDACLTSPQIVALKKLYSGSIDGNGRLIFPGHMPGGELGPNGWSPWITGSAPQTSLEFDFGTHFFEDMVFNNPAWDFRSSDIDADTQIADHKLASIFNSTNPNLRAFQARGGKLILYHGWSDSAISPLNTINYYNSVLTAMGRQQAESLIRLYMVPGMQHCGDGPGPDSFGALAALNADPSHSIFSSLEQWVEKGVPPGTIIATKYATASGSPPVVEMIRPLCPYPEVAQYKGTGDIHEAASFVCSVKQ